MFMKQSLFCIGALLMVVSGIAQSGQSPVVIEGKVVAEATGQPVANAHVYIVEGEEEAVTGSKGEFRIQSWQKTPLTLTVNGYQQFGKVRITVSDPTRRQLIRLKVRSS